MQRYIIQQSPKNVKYPVYTCGHSRCAHSPLKIPLFQRDTSIGTEVAGGDCAPHSRATAAMASASRWGKPPGRRPLGLMFVLRIPRCSSFLPNYFSNRKKTFCYENSRFWPISTGFTCGFFLPFKIAVWVGWKPCADVPTVREPCFGSHIECRPCTHFLMRHKPEVWESLLFPGSNPGYNKVSSLKVH